MSGPAAAGRPHHYEQSRRLLEHRAAPLERDCKSCGEEWPCADYRAANEALRGIGR